jgi:hypothetical protein
VGILNAAVWCGSAVFLTIALPAIFSPEMKNLLTAERVGFAAEAMVARFFLLQYCCGAIALAHLLAERLYCGKPARNFNWTLVLAMLIAALAGGLWAQPKMNHLHLVKYFGTIAEQREQAGKSFAAWHAASESINLLVMVGLVVYLWRVSNPPESPRYGGLSKNPGLTKGGFY